MTPAQYAKAKALAADERTDPATREIAQRQVGGSGRPNSRERLPEKKLASWARSIARISGWGKNMEVGNREREPWDWSHLDTMNEVLGILLEHA